MSVTSINGKTLPASAHKSAGANTKSGDLRVESRLQGYADHFSRTGEDTDAGKANRLDQYTDVVNGECGTFVLVGTKVASSSLGM